MSSSFCAKQHSTMLVIPMFRLSMLLSDRWIGRIAPISWFQRSPVLALVEFSCGVQLKTLCMSNDRHWNSNIPTAGQRVNGARYCLEVCKAVNGAHMKLYWFAVIFPYFAILQFWVRFCNTKKTCSTVLDGFISYTSHLVRFNFPLYTVLCRLCRYILRCQIPEFLSRFQAHRFLTWKWLMIALCTGENECKKCHYITIAM